MSRSLLLAVCLFVAVLADDATNRFAVLDADDNQQLDFNDKPTSVRATEWNKFLEMSDADKNQIVDFAEFRAVFEDMRSDDTRVAVETPAVGEKGSGSKGGSTFKGKGAGRGKGGRPRRPRAKCLAYQATDPCGAGRPLLKAIYGRGPLEFPRTVGGKLVKNTPTVANGCCSGCSVLPTSFPKGSTGFAIEDSCVGATGTEFVDDCASISDGSVCRPKCATGVGMGSWTCNCGCWEQVGVPACGLSCSEHNGGCDAGTSCTPDSTSPTGRKCSPCSDFNVANAVVDSSGTSDTICVSYLFGCSTNACYPPEQMYCDTSVPSNPTCRVDKCVEMDATCKAQGLRCQRNGDDYACVV